MKYIVIILTSCSQEYDHVAVKYFTSRDLSEALFFPNLDGFFGFVCLPYLLRGVADE